MPTERDTNRDMDDILIVDDDSANLKLLSEILVKKGYRVRPANRPQLAIDSASSQPPKLILLDVMMPEMDGFEVCRQLQQNSRTRNVPIIFISALPDAEEKVAGFEAGCVDFISKPFDPLEVLSRVCTHVSLRNLRLNMEEQVRKRTEEIIKSEAHFRATFEQAAVGIAHVTPQGRFLRLNDKFCDIVGYDRAEMLGLTYRDITHPNDLDADCEQIHRLLNDEIKTYSVEKCYIRKAGDPVWVKLTVSLVRDNNGQPEWFVKVIQDITEQKKAQEDLYLIKETVEASSDSVYWIDRAGRFVYVNKAACNQLGYKRDELLQLNIFDVDSFASKEKWNELWARRQELGVIQLESAHRRRDGSEFPVEISSVYVEFNGLELINGFARDISDRKQVEMALLKSEHLARTLLNATTDLTHLIDEDGIILDLNDAMARGLRGTREELVGTCVFDMFSAASAKARKNQIRQALADNKPLRYVERNHPDVVYDTGIYPVLTPPGEKDQVVIFAHDITEKEKALQALQESEKKFRRLVGNIPDVIWTTDSTGKTVYISENVRDVFGFSQDEVYRLSDVWIDRIHPDDVDRIMQQFARLFQDGERFNVEYRIRHKDGHWIWLYDRSTAVYQKDGVSYADGLFSDITFRKQAELDLKQGRDYLEHLMNSIPDAVFSVKLPERTVEWARDSYGVLGHDLDKYIGNTTEWLYSSSEEYQAFGELIQSAIRNISDSFIAQTSMLNKKGEVLQVEVNATILRDKDEPVSMIGLVRDITERKELEQELRQNEEMLRKAHEIAHLGSWSWDLASDQLTWSDEMYRIYGLDPGMPLTFKSLLDMIHPADREYHKQLAAELIEGKTDRSFRYRIQRPNGGFRFIYGKGLVEKGESGAPVRLSGTLQDVTELETVEMAFRSSETRLKEAQRIARIGFWELDARTNKLSWSDEVFQMLEINQQDFQASFELFLSIIHPEDRQMVSEQHNQSLDTRKPYSETCRIVLPGGHVRHLYRTAKPIFDHDGKLLRIIGVLQDITQLKEAQNESMKLRLEMAHLNRVMMMDELAASLAHEINQPLGAIVNNVSVAKNLHTQGVGGGSDLIEIMNDIADDAMRAGNIIRRIRGVMQKTDAVFTSLDVNKLLDDVHSLYQNSFTMERVTVSVEKDPDLPLVYGDRVRLQQVLMNLIANAMDAMVDSTKKILVLQTAQTDGMVTVSVTDSGIGIELSKSRKIFNPFFTTKREGMGIGLRLCQSIVEEHGGRIWVESALGAGSSFFFTLKVYTPGDRDEHSKGDRLYR